MPSNLYGIGDNFHPENGHVIPAMMTKFNNSNGKTVTFWGDGTPMREFLYSDDLADACVFLMNTYSDEGLVNIGTGEDISISDLALMIKEVVGYEGAIVYDASKPDGTPRKLMDVSKLSKLGWNYTIPLKKGLEMVYQEYQSRQ